MHFRYQAIQTLLDNRNDTAIDWNFALRYLSWDYDTEDRLSSLLAVLDGHIPDEYRVRVFIAACIRGRLKIVNLLLQRNIDPNVQWLESSGLEAPLQAASRRGHLEIAQALVECGAELDMYFEGSCDSPLYAASGQGHLNIVQYLVRVGANVNMEGGNDGTAFQAASAAGHLEIARYLLGNGADLAVTGGTSRDALQLAAEGPHLDMVELLVSSGARVKPRSARDLLSKACRHGHPGLAKLLLIRGLVPDLNSDDLQTAASFGHLEIVKILLENGADPNRPGDQYGSPLMMTEDEKYPEVRQLLLEYGAVPGIW
jgi:ankyrin repeat protein